MPKVPKISNLQNLPMQYLNREGSDELDFLHGDKHQTFLKVDTINFDGYIDLCPKKIKNKFVKSLQYLEKEVRDKVDFTCR